MEIIKTVWPLIVIQWGLQIYALIDLFRKKKAKNLPVAVWAIIIIAGGLVGATVYLILGRSEE